MVGCTTLYQTVRFADIQLLTQTIPAENDEVFDFLPFDFPPQSGTESVPLIYFDYWK